MKQIIVTIISHRDLLWALIVRDIKVRYKQSILGAGWAILQPLLMMLIFTIIFSRFTTIPTDGIPYPIFSY
jgi:lipopolysaccharide transport system permease protein